MAATKTFNSLAGLNKALGKLSRSASDELRVAALGIADGIAAEARGRAERLGGTARHVAPSIRSRRDRVPKISMGGRDSMAAAFGAEFGGARRATTMQFEPWRGSTTGAGYFLWPTIRDRNDWINARYSEALNRALQELR